MLLTTPSSIHYYAEMGLKLHRSAKLLYEETRDMLAAFASAIGTIYGGIDRKWSSWGRWKHLQKSGSCFVLYALSIIIW